MSGRKYVFDVTETFIVNGDNSLCWKTRLPHSLIRRVLFLFPRYYTATVIKSAGITDDHYAIWLSAGVAAINVLFSIVGLSLVDKIGRRKLLFSSYLGKSYGTEFHTCNFQENIAIFTSKTSQ